MDKSEKANTDERVTDQNRQRKDTVPPASTEEPKIPGSTPLSRQSHDVETPKKDR